MSRRLPKQERLKSRKVISSLFENGASRSKGAVRMFYTPSEFGDHTQVAFSVPKKNFRLAVSRNRIKRQLRAAYQLHKQLLMSNNGRKFALLFLYLGKDEPRFDRLEWAIEELLKNLRDESI